MKSPEEKFTYLMNNIFKDLVYDLDECTPTIIYFNDRDFAKVLQSVEENGLGVFGIETILNGEYFSVEVFEDYQTNPYDSNWYTAAFNKLKSKNSELRYSASYCIPNA